MASCSPTRQALSNLPINTHGSPQALSPSKKTITTLKRRIMDVDCVQSPPSSVRFRLTQGVDDNRRSMQDGFSIIEKTAQASLTENPPDTNMPQEAEEGDSQESLKDSTTSLTDLDPLDDTIASQQTAATEISQPGQSAVSMRAEILRLRLRVAMFKIRTNQTNLPMSQLQVPSNSPRSQYPTSTVSPEQANAFPRLLPAPELRPTAYSARTIPIDHLPSSPPNSRRNSPDSKLQEEVFRTPALPNGKTRTMELHLSSPPDNHGGNGRTLDAPDGLTSSAVRGSVARSLLGLAHTGR